MHDLDASGDSELRIGSLFSGYGGLALAVEHAFNATTAWFSELNEPVARDITITTPAGRCPTWRIDGDPSTWAIHIHGSGSTRAGPLRGVRTATGLGYISLVVSYRNTAEGPTVGTGRTTLGHTEAADVDEALGYAVRRGAQQIVLFGWSMGAAIALQLANRPRHEGLIAALVLDSPALNWTEIIKANCARSGQPSRDPVAHPRPTGSRSQLAGPHPAPLF